ncbi:pilus assembly protein CpaB [Nocardioides sp. GY 10127]|nr:pilus assembly protein CpaB [Nocardioides sp. GY 10127]
MRLGAARRRLRALVLGHRRLLAAGLTAVAVAAGLHAVSTPPPASVEVVVAAADLPAGHVVAPDDLTSVAQLPGAVPEDVVADPVGAVLAGPVSAGEPLTRARLVGPGLASPGLAAVPVRLPDAGTAALLDVGDTVDLLATGSGSGAGGDSRVVATDVTVLALPADSGSGPAGVAGGRVVVLGVPDELVTPVVDAAARTFLSYAWAG